MGEGEGEGEVEWEGEGGRTNGLEIETTNLCVHDMLHIYPLCAIV